MSAAPSVHDNILLSYTVDAEERRITLQTAYLDHEPHEHTTVVFSEVLAYHFEGDTLGTILFDIQVVSAADIYVAYSDVFARRKQYGWPSVEYGTMEDLVDVLQARGIKSYLINSSCGELLSNPVDQVGQAAPPSGVRSGRVPWAEGTGFPSLKRTPSRSSRTRCGAFTFRHRCWALLTSL